MAKKRDFAVSPDSFNETRLPDTASPVLEHTPTPDYTHTHKHEHEYELVAKKRKTRRIQILTFEDLVDAMDAYAKECGVSRAEVFEAGMIKYLKDLGKYPG